MRTKIDPSNPPAIYEWEGPTGVKFRDVREPSGTYYRDTTPREVIDCLEHVMKSGKRVRLFIGDRETGKNWLDEYDVVGRVGRSMGPIKVPLLIEKGEDGGGAILCDCVVCLMVEMYGTFRVAYKHPKFEFPTIHIWHESVFPKSPWAADVNGDKCHARFKSKLAAQRWADFMQGKRLTK